MTLQVAQQLESMDSNDLAGPDHQSSEFQIGHVDAKVRARIIPHQQPFGHGIVVLDDRVYIHD